MFVFSGIAFDRLGNYTLAFTIAGLTPMIASIILCFMPKIPRSSPSIRRSPNRSRTSQ